ncbi:uncharacterized protein LOC130662334 [Hydractinia symbiolongicarpus]|uniref:uncharacterized protein LOC130641362 n=1 Tax=Hydractinia symbiolongicarpus TaxID=13093 RepID=UPI00254DB7CA|nr:uncharacterized protein LOC130641362 [Hydractinia symbiolongicarpus]XP_057317156.1 uncharacterized protein LOC130662334 [Hydractinia symbiolongicarpus]
MFKNRKCNNREYDSVQLSFLFCENICYNKNIKMPKANKTLQKKNSEGNPGNVFSLEEEVGKNMRDAGYDGSLFISALKDAVKIRKKRSKTPRKIRFSFYCYWARNLLRKEVGPENPEYSFPPSILSYLRSLCPGDIVGEFRENAYKVSMTEFCDSLELPLITV